MLRPFTALILREESMLKSIAATIERRAFNPLFRLLGTKSSTLELQMRFKPIMPDARFKRLYVKPLYG